MKPQIWISKDCSVNNFDIVLKILIDVMKFKIGMDYRMLMILLSKIMISVNDLLELSKIELKSEGKWGNIIFKL